MNVLQLVVDLFCYIFAHNQFTYIEERSNEPLGIILMCACSSNRKLNNINNLPFGQPFCKETDVVNLRRYILPASCHLVHCSDSSFHTVEAEG